MPDDIATDLAEARATLQAARNVIHPLQDAALGDTEAFRRLADQLDRLTAEVARIEGVVESVAIPSAKRAV